MRFDSYHPAINLAYFTAVLAAAVVFDHPCFLAVAYVCAFVYSAALGGRRALVFDLALGPLMAAFALYYGAYRHFGVTVLGVNFIGNRITLEALVYGLVLAGKTAVVLMWLSCMHAVVSSDKLVYLFGRVLPRLSLYLAIVLRAVPRIRERFRSASLARSGVGRGGQQGGAVRRVRNFLSIASIVTTWTLEDLVESAASMKSRGYSLRGRTAFSIYRFDDRDKNVLAWLIFCGAYILSGWLAGGMYFRYYPTVKTALWTPLTISFMFVYLALVLTPVILDRKEDRQWKSLRSEI